MGHRARSCAPGNTDRPGSRPDDQGRCRRRGGAVQRAGWVHRCDTRRSGGSMMQTTDHEQGAAIAFQLMEEGGTEDIRRYMLGLPFHAIPPDWTAHHALRAALRGYGPLLVQSAIDATHQADRAQLDATGWVTRRNSYIVRGRVF